MKLGTRTLLGGFLVVAALLLIDSEAPQSALAYQQKGGGGKQSPPASRTDPKVLALLRDSVARATKSTVRILCDGKEAALGVIVTPDGFILTKASDLTGKISVKLAGGVEMDAKWVGHHQPHDLAMLKIEANNLTPIEFTDSSVAPVGNFIASVGTGPDPVAIGVVSVAARNVPPGKEGGPKAGNPTTGLLGITTIDDPKGAKVSGFANAGKGGFGGKGGGGKGGGGGGKGGGGGGFNNPNAGKIKEGDIILALGEKIIKDSDTLKQELQKYKAGQDITLKLLRGEEEMEMKLKLNAPQQKQDQNKMGSELSERRTGFPTILQHDSVVKPSDCGGPLCDLEGHVIGLNICRWGRVESYAVPSETIKPLLADLMSGKMPRKQ